MRAVADEAGYSEGIPIAKIHVDRAVAGKSAADVAAELLAGEPGVKVGQQRDTLSVNPPLLEPGEERLVAERLRQVLGVRELVGSR